MLVNGLLLIIIAVFLIQGSKRAWYTAVFLTTISIIGHIIKGIDYEEASFTALALLSLYFTQSYYTLKSNPSFTRISFQVILYGLVAILLYGVIGFYYIGPRHFGVNFHFIQSLKIVFKLFFFLNDSGLEPHTRFAKFFIDSFYWTGACYILFVAYGLLSPYFKKPFNTEEDIVFVNRLAAKYGHSTLDYFKLYSDKLFFISTHKNAFISFKTTRHIALALEDPVAENPEAMKVAIQEFDQYCQEIGLVSVYYRVSSESLALYSSLNKKNFPIGEEAIVNLNDFNLEGSKMKAFRNTIKHSTEAGYTFNIHNPPIEEKTLQDLEIVSNEWLEEIGKKEFAFTEGIFDKAILKNQTILTIENQEGTVYAFLNLIPSYEPNVACYDMIRKAKDTPNGILDLLLIKTFYYLKEQGYQKINMGLAQLSGLEGANITEKTVKFAYENLKIFDQFKGLRKYKEKFNPTWQKKYLVYDHSFNLLQVPLALKKVTES